LSVRSLRSKYKSAIEGRERSEAAFKDLNANVDEVPLAEWQEEESKAMENRGEYLRIYEVQIEKGLFFAVGEDSMLTNHLSIQPLLWLRSDSNCPRVKKMWAWLEELLHG
jgi:hypothetical protein